MDWFEKAEFWSLFYGRMFPPESFEAAKEQTGEILTLTGVHSGNVLDMCCGPGRHSVPLAQKGFAVTGVDLTQLLLDKARTYAETSEVNVNWVQQDMLAFKTEPQFHLALSLFSSFGYFKNSGDDLIVLKNLYASLLNGGQLVIDVRGKEIHAMNLQDCISTQLPNGDLVFEQVCVNENWTRSDSTWVYIHGSQARRFEVSFNLYSGAELRSMLQQVGFHKIHLYGSLKGIPYNDKAQRLVVVATKP